MRLPLSTAAVVLAGAGAMLLVPVALFTDSCLTQAVSARAALIASAIGPRYCLVMNVPRCMKCPAGTLDVVVGRAQRLPGSADAAGYARSIVTGRTVSKVRGRSEPVPAGLVRAPYASAPDESSGNGAERPEGSRSGATAPPEMMKAFA